MIPRLTLACVCAAAVLLGCGSIGSSSARNDPDASRTAATTPGASCDRAGSPVTPAPISVPPGLHVPQGFTIDTIAQVGGARELAALPNGDLLVATQGSQVYLVPNAEGTPGSPVVFATIRDNQAAGIAFAASRCEIYVGSTNHVWAIHYTGGMRTARAVRRIADVRTGPVVPGTDGDIHTTTSVAFAGGSVYISVGSSCNATMDYGAKPCVETDPTRAAISVTGPGGANFTQRAQRVRNAIAFAVNPQTHSVWIGGAGQDDLPSGHPYEYLDDLSAHTGDADYGWPVCEENHHAYWPHAHCGKTVEPLIELPAYSTIVGAVFYPVDQSGAYAFPAPYHGALFAAVHGSWHTHNDGCSATPPRVAYIPMDGDRPKHPVNWSNPRTQAQNFVTGFQSGCTSRIGRPTGIAVGPKGSLFVADDDADVIYRIRPSER